MAVVLYGVGIHEAIGTGDLRKMKALRKKAQAHLKKHGNVASAMEVLEAEIQKLEYANKTKSKPRAKAKRKKK